MTSSSSITLLLSPSSVNKDNFTRLDEYQILTVARIKMASSHDIDLGIERRLSDGDGTLLSGDAADGSSFRCCDAMLIDFRTTRFMVLLSVL